MITTKLRTNVTKGIIEANELLESESEFMQWYTKPEFIEFVPDMATGDFLKFILVLRTWIQAHDVEVKLWTPLKWRFSAAIAMTTGTHISLNRFKLDRSIASIVGSIVHELAHIVDGKFKSHVYWHGNNYRHGSDFPMGKRRTTPYLLGELAKEYVANGKLYTSKELQAWPQTWS